jgi:hypothetical protein
MKVKLIAPAVVDETKRGMQGRVFQLPLQLLPLLLINFSFRKEIAATQEL